MSNVEEGEIAEGAPPSERDSTGYNSGGGSRGHMRPPPPPPPPPPHPHPHPHQSDYNSRHAFGRGGNERGGGGGDRNERGGGGGERNIDSKRRDDRMSGVYSPYNQPELSRGISAPDMHSRSSGNDHWGSGGGGYSGGGSNNEYNQRSRGDSFFSGGGRGDRDSYGGGSGDQYGRYRFSSHYGNSGGNRGDVSGGGGMSYRNSDRSSDRSSDRMSSSSHNKPMMSRGYSVPDHSRDSLDNSKMASSGTPRNIQLAGDVKSRLPGPNRSDFHRRHSGEYTVDAVRVPHDEKPISGVSASTGNAPVNTLVVNTLLAPVTSAAASESRVDGPPIMSYIPSPVSASKTPVITDASLAADAFVGMSGGTSVGTPATHVAPLNALPAPVVSVPPLATYGNVPPPPPPNVVRLPVHPMGESVALPPILPLNVVGPPHGHPIVPAGLPPAPFTVSVPPVSSTATPSATITATALQLPPHPPAVASVELPTTPSDISTVTASANNSTMSSSTPVPVKVSTTTEIAKPSNEAFKPAEIPNSPARSTEVTEIPRAASPITFNISLDVLEEPSAVAAVPSFFNIDALIEPSSAAATSDSLIGGVSSTSASLGGTSSAAVVPGARPSLSVISSVSTEDVQTEAPSTARRPRAAWGQSIRRAPTVVAAPPVPGTTAATEPVTGATSTVPTSSDTPVETAPVTSDEPLATATSTTPTTPVPESTAEKIVTTKAEVVDNKTTVTQDVPTAGMPPSTVPDSGVSSTPMEEEAEMEFSSPPQPETISVAVEAPTLSEEKGDFMEIEPVVQETEIVNESEPVDDNMDIDVEKTTVVSSATTENILEEAEADLSAPSVSNNQSADEVAKEETEARQKKKQRVKKLGEDTIASSGISAVEATSPPVEEVGTSIPATTPATAKVPKSVRKTDRKRVTISSSGVESSEIASSDWRYYDGNQALSSSDWMAQFRLNGVFSSEVDIQRAYTTMVYMLELQKAAAEGGDRSTIAELESLSTALQSVKTMEAAGRLILPKTREVAQSLDLLETTIDNHYTFLRTYRENQYMLEHKLREIDLTPPVNPANISAMASTPGSVSNEISETVNHPPPMTKLQRTRSTSLETTTSANAIVSPSSETVPSPASATTTGSVSSAAPNKFSKAHNSSTPTPPVTASSPKSESVLPPKTKRGTPNAATLAMIREFQRHNQLRAVEAHLFTTMVRQAEPLLPLLPKKKKVGASVESNGDSSTKDDSDTLPELESPRKFEFGDKIRGLFSRNSAAQRVLNELCSVSDTVEMYIHPGAGISASFPGGGYRGVQMKSPQENDGYEENIRRMTKNRSAVTAVIRKKKMARRRAWELLCDRFLSVQRHWKAHIAAIEAEEALRDGDSKLRSGALLTSVFDSPATRGTFKPCIQGGGSSVVNVGGVSAESTTTGLPTRNSMNSAAVRNDAENDRLLTEICIEEQRQARLEASTCRIPAMSSPWCYPDATRPPLPPRWPPTEAGSSKVYDSSNLAELPSLIKDTPSPTETAYPVAVHDVHDVIDSSSHRLTTDGRRALCSLLPKNVPCPPHCNCPATVERMSAFTSVWSDTEKAIFIDKFLQFPKNFHRIASFLPRRSTKDCIKFYYDFKASAEFKHLLKEHDPRRRTTTHRSSAAIFAAAQAAGNANTAGVTGSTGGIGGTASTNIGATAGSTGTNAQIVGFNNSTVSTQANGSLGAVSVSNWPVSVKVAHMIGAAVYPSTTEGSRELLAQIPATDMSFSSFALAPPARAATFSVPLSVTQSVLAREGPDHDRRYIMAQLYPRRATIATALRRRMEELMLEADRLAATRSERLGRRQGAGGRAIDELEAAENALASNIEEVLADYDRHIASDPDNAVASSGSPHSKVSKVSEYKSDELIGDVLPRDPFSGRFAYVFPSQLSFAERVAASEASGSSVGSASSTASYPKTSVGNAEKQYEQFVASLLPAYLYGEKSPNGRLLPRAMSAEFYHNNPVAMMEDSNNTTTTAPENVTTTNVAETQSGARERRKADRQTSATPVKGTKGSTKDSTTSAANTAPTPATPSVNAAGETTSSVPSRPTKTNKLNPDGTLAAPRRRTNNPRQPKVPAKVDSALASGNVPSNGTIELPATTTTVQQPTVQGSISSGIGLPNQMVALQLAAMGAANANAAAGEGTVPSEMIGVQSLHMAALLANQAASGAPIVSHGAPPVDITTSATPYGQSASTYYPSVVANNEDNTRKRIASSVATEDALTLMSRVASPVNTTPVTGADALSAAVAVAQQQAATTAAVNYGLQANTVAGIPPFYGKSEREMTPLELYTIQCLAVQQQQQEQAVFQAAQQAAAAQKAAQQAAMSAASGNPAAIAQASASAAAASQAVASFQAKAAAAADVEVAAPRLKVPRQDAMTLSDLLQAATTVGTLDAPTVPIAPVAAPVVHNVDIVQPSTLVPVAQPTVAAGPLVVEHPSIAVPVQSSTISNAASVPVAPPVVPTAAVPAAAAFTPEAVMSSIQALSAILPVTDPSTLMAICMQLAMQNLASSGYRLPVPNPGAVPTPAAPMVIPVAPATAPSPVTSAPVVPSVSLAPTTETVVTAPTEVPTPPHDE